MSAHRSNRSRRRRFDDDDQPDTALDARRSDLDQEETDELTWSTYPAATKGPRPAPVWVVTDPRAIDVDLGVMKTGKEAEVSLVRRHVPDGALGADVVYAVKRYRSADHRLFHRDAGYLEGRRVRRSRETRAMATRTGFGKELIAHQWATAEFAVLGSLWTAGASVPYPVQLLGTEIMMEFIGTDGVAAPRLAQVGHDTIDTASLFRQLVESLGVLADQGYAHGDLSAYNVLVDDGRVVLIDLPQAVDVVGNPQGFDYLRRDCENICGWFAAHGVPTANGDVLFDELRSRAVGRGV